MQLKDMKSKNVFIRTVTHYYTGKIVDVNKKEVALIDAAWVADTGRFSAALEKGEFDEVEPYPPELTVIINRDVIVDAIEWRHDLPRDRK